MRARSRHETSAFFRNRSLTIVDTKVRNTSFLDFLAGQEAETVHAVVERNIDDGITKFDGARNEGGGIEQRSISSREPTPVKPDNDRKLGISGNSSGAEHVQVKTWEDCLGILTRKIL